MDPDPRDHAVERTLAEHRSAFIAFVEGRVRDRALAEDLVQGAYEHGLPRIGDVRDEGAVIAWFYRSLRNAIVSRHRRCASEERALSGLALELDGRIDAEAVTPAQVCKCVLGVARTLRPAYADAIEQIEIDGVAVKAFAAERGISSSNAAVRVFRAREALRRGVLATCGACAAAGCTDCTCGDAAPSRTR